MSTTREELKQKAKEKIGSLKTAVIRKANGVIPYDYIVPNGVYEEQWDWDAFFVGLFLISENPADGVYLKNWCLNFLHHMEPDGQTPGGLRPWSGRDARLYQLKPLMGQGAYYGSRAIGDYSWIEPVWDKMKMCVLYRDGKMKNPETGLVKWWDSMETGADSNPAITRRYHNSVAGADTNGFMYLDYKAMAHIAAQLSKKEDEEIFRKKAEELKIAINKHLWHEQDQTYYNYDTVEKQHIKHITYSNQIPLWAEIASPEQAKAMIEKYVLNEDKLWAPHGIRSLAKDDRFYNNDNILKPYSNWSGPIWPHVNWMFMHALMHYGYPEKALEVAERVTRVCLDDIEKNYMMRENYHADTGEPLAAPNFISWNLLVVQMIEEAERGIFLPDPERKVWSI